MINSINKLYGNYVHIIRLFISFGKYIPRDLIKVVWNNWRDGLSFDVGSTL